MGFHFKFTINQVVIGEAKFAAYRPKIDRELPRLTPAALKSGLQKWESQC